MDARREEESWWNKKNSGKSRTQASTFEDVARHNEEENARRKGKIKAKGTSSEDVLNEEEKGKRRRAHG
jgi:hypothetical protein